MVRVDRISNSADVEALAPAWQALWRWVPNATPFQSPEWLLPWWKYYGNAAPSVAAAYDGGRLIGLLPFYILDEQACHKLLPFGVSLSDYFDALIDPRYPGLGNTLLECLLAVPDWDECLPNLPPRGALIAVGCPAAFSEDWSDGETCPVLRLPSAIERLHETVPQKTLRYLCRARRRAVSVGEVNVTSAEKRSIAASMGELFRLHECRCQRAGGSGVCADPIVRGFHLTAATQLADAGMLRLYLLRVGNSLAAVYYGFTVKSSAYAYLSGFDSDYAALRPGAQLIHHAIEQAIREGVQEFHFLRGGEAYKYSWGAVDQPNMVRTVSGDADGNPQYSVPAAAARTTRPLFGRRNFR
jgi:CelD/BcsL family acetyltransferase involved in cellulose biosynthesis